MSHLYQTLRARLRAIRPSLNAERLFLITLLVLGAMLYLWHAFQYYMYDDEGAYAYASWRISVGEMPYRDFLTPQMPVFLYWGGLIVHFLGRSFVALRVTTMLVMLLTAALLYLTNRELLGRPVAFLSLGFFLFEANVFHNARYFRPEAYMLLFQVAALYCFVLGEKRNRLPYIALTGALFGLATLSKLFGMLPWGGCGAYLLYAWWRERRTWRQTLRELLALGLPMVFIVGAAAVFFTRATPYFITAVLGHHLMQGAELTPLQRILQAARFLWGYVASQPLMALLAMGGAGLLLRRQKALPSLLVWQLPTTASFFILSRSLESRHLTYLAPALATLVAAALGSLCRARRWTWGLALLLALVASQPWITTDRNLAAWEEHDSQGLVERIQQYSSPDQVVVLDYPGINFMAGRKSTYWTAGLSGGSTQSGQVRGAALIQEIQRQPTALVVINTAGGAHHMTSMVDYPIFRQYVQTHFSLIDKYQVSYHQFEIYSQRDTMSVQSRIEFSGGIALAGTRVPEGAVTSGSTLAIATRWQTSQRISHDYSVSLRLVDASGHLWAQQDDALIEIFSHEIKSGIDEFERLATSNWQPQQIVLQQHALSIPPTTPPGEYYLTLWLYDPQSGATLSPSQELGHSMLGEAPVISTLHLLPTSQPPNAATLPIAVPLQTAASDGLELLGAGPLPTSARADKSISFELFWRASKQPLQDDHLRFLLVQNEQVWQSWSATVAGNYNTSAWREGEILLGHYALPLASDLPDGEYALAVEVIDSAGLVEGRMTVIDRLPTQGKPDATKFVQAISHHLEGVSFDGRIELLGYDLSAETATPGMSLGLTLYWRCQQPPERDYKVFVHLVDAASRVQGQSDAMPDQWNAPTSGWEEDDLLADRYEVPLAETASSGVLRIEVGFYDPVTQQRLPVVFKDKPTSDDCVILPTEVTVP